MPFTEESIFNSVMDGYGYVLYVSQDKKLIIEIDFSDKYKNQYDLINKIYE